MCYNKEHGKIDWLMIRFGEGREEAFRLMNMWQSISRNRGRSLGGHSLPTGTLQTKLSQIWWIFPVKEATIGCFHYVEVGSGVGD